ncbi:MAG TPA: ATP-binding protein, partial [Longimicrobiales bacterium]|nr:ATP-binding protein [Longimicrobiales bacterium]
PTVLFGWIAYRAFAGEITRAARATAERAVAQAVAMYPDEEQSLAVVANRIGAEVLQYHRGELILASSPEAVALGLYDAWMPATVYSALRSGEQLSVVETREIINHPYLLAYRRLAATGILAVPVSLRSGEAAIRQNELMHLVLFAILLGGILSLALSVAVGRALTEPIGQLQRAAAAVGAGRLNVRLPERRSDEFGDLFASFNRMIQRLRRARAQEIRSARVLAWGEMARQIAHEIKNPLTPIKLSVQHLKRAYRDQRPDFGDVLESNVDHVLMEIDRLSAVARAFSRYGAPSSSEDPLEPTPVDDIVREVVGLYRAGESDIRFEYDVGPDLPPALARPGELKEVLFNIVENARDAVDAGGSISVTANAADDHIEVVVSDDGHGIEPGMLDRIFEPHFSTRSTGTGLGLAIVRRLVEGWGGRIEVQSLPGDGTTIRIRMKRADRP